jgi:hypothetical protein
VASRGHEVSEPEFASPAQPKPRGYVLRSEREVVRSAWLFGAYEWMVTETVVGNGTPPPSDARGHIDFYCDRKRLPEGPHFQDALIARVLELEIELEKAHAVLVGPPVVVG